MAGSSWNETIADVNKTLSNMNSAISGANGAATLAGEANENAEEQAAQALEATNAANAAASEADAEAEKWKNATASAKALDAGSTPTVEIVEQDNVKHFIFGVPRGADGATGAKGDMGRSGVTFNLSGSVLTITTD